jgi:hypothetical protein
VTDGYQAQDFEADFAVGIELDSRGGGGRDAAEQA